MIKASDIERHNMTNITTNVPPAPENFSHEYYNLAYVNDKSEEKQRENVHLTSKPPSFRVDKNITKTLDV